MRSRYHLIFVTEVTSMR